MNFEICPGTCVPTVHHKPETVLLPKSLWDPMGGSSNKAIGVGLGD